MKLSRRTGNIFKGPELREMVFDNAYPKMSTKTSPCSGNTAFSPLHLSEFALDHKYHDAHTAFQLTLATGETPPPAQNPTTIKYKSHPSVSKPNPGYVVQ